ncbi:MAG: hypothetical protein JSS49_01560 [Planctomycetes bacterium]|nr:hypothetical protein [Planctomycetota bacterium]
MVKTSRLLVWGITWLVLLSAASAQDQPPEVILIRGGAGYWPRVTAFTQELSDHGFSSRSIFGAAYALHAPRIANEYHSGQRNGPVTIIGYSSGADYACRLCGSLESRGVPVATLVLIESTLGTDVPANVDLCVNLYESRPATDWIPAFRGIPVQAVGQDTQLINLDTRSNDDLKWMTAYNHFTVASHTDTHVMLRNLLLLRQSQYLQQSQTATVPIPPSR